MKTLHSLPLLFAGLLVGFAAVADEIITLKTRPEVTQSMLLWEPYSQTPDVVIVLFPGGPGNVALEIKDGRATATRPYVFSRQREILAQPQFAVVVIDAPSDQKDMGQEFRLSAKHLTDIEVAIREVRSRFPKARLVIMGHSRGTVSAGYASRALGDQVSAVVLLSGVYRATKLDPLIPSSGPGLSELDLGSLKVPTLIVHNTKDACPAAPFKPAEEVSGKLSMITVNGSDEANIGSPCGPGTNHWFVGMEKATGDEVVKWLIGKSWNRTVP
jgi:hypothetical protein